MNLRHLSLVLLITNIVLLVAVAILAARLNRPVQQAAPVETPVYIGNTVTQIAVKKFNATNLLAELTSRRFGWKSIESTNYVLYIINLRSIGCPEETIRDIIIADIAKLYAQQREDLRQAYPPAPYWRTLRAGESLASADPEFAAAYRALDQARSQLVQDLLAVEYHAEISKFGSGSEDLYPVLSFLPQDKQERVRALLASARPGPDTGGGRGYYTAGGGLDYLLEGADGTLAGVLSPEELRLLELYASSLAEQLRHELYGFEPSQAEFDQIYRVRKAHQQVLAATIENNPDLPSDRVDSGLAQADAAMTAELYRILGKDRFVAYRKSTDPDWQVLIGRMQVSEEVASQIYTMKQQAALQKQKIEINPTLTLEQRHLALSAIRQETQNTLASVLGSGAYDEYRRLGGDWLANLDRAAPDAVAPAAPNAQPPPPPPPVIQPDGTRTIVREILVPDPVPVPVPPIGPIRQ